MYLEINGKTLINNDGRMIGSANPTHKFAAGQVYAYNTADLEKSATPAELSELGSEMNLKDYAQRMKQGLDQAKAAFVGMDEIIDGIGVALTAGEDIFLISPPGTAKTTLARTIAKIASANFASILFHSELSYSEIVGGFDPEAAMNGKMERKLDRLGDAHIALLDEIWKAGASVTNMLLDILEGKVVEDRPIKLLSTISASNELPQERESSAMWDRLLLRFSVKDLDADGFEEMLVAAAGSSVITPVLDAEEIRLASAAAELIALNVDRPFLKAIRELREAAKNEGITASNRRWRKIVKAAAAQSILDGEELDQSHLIVASDILWSDPDEAKAVRKVVQAVVDPLANAVFNILALWENFQTDFEDHDLKTTDLNLVQELLEKGALVQGEIDKVKPAAKNGNLEALSQIEVELGVLVRMVERGR